jgi:hypothetical protein
VCLEACYYKEALKIAIRARLWDVAENVCLVCPDLKKDLMTARAMADGALIEPHESFNRAVIEP